MKMRLFTLLLLCSPIFLFGQIGIGVKAGANFANVSSDSFDSNSKTSIHVGAYVNLKLSDKWGITPEVLWSSQGADLDNSEFKTDYITVPIMLRWHIIDLISLEAGPQFNFLTSAESGGVDIKDQLNDPSYSAAFGAVVHLPLGFNGGIRYVAGLTDLSKSDNEKITDQNFQIYVGWTIFGAK